MKQNPIFDFVTLSNSSIPMTAVVMVKLTAQLWSSPFDAGSSCAASFGIGSHSSAETLTVTSSVTSTGVSHTRIIVWARIDLKHKAVTSNMVSFSF